MNPIQTDLLGAVLSGSIWERSGSVVECLTQDRRPVGSSLTDVLEQDTFILA